MRRKERSPSLLFFFLGCSVASLSWWSLALIMMIMPPNRCVVLRAFAPSSSSATITRLLPVTSRIAEDRRGTTCYRLRISTVQNRCCIDGIVRRLRRSAGQFAVFSTSRADEVPNNDSRPNAVAATTDDEDIRYMQQAIEHARNGLGHTYPNPAVGCVVVRHNTNDNLHQDGAERPDAQVLGTGFHPRVGYPHAEVFALLEAFGHVHDGVAAARSIVEQRRGGGTSSATGRRRDDSAKDSDATTRLAATVTNLTAQYIQGGAQALFGSGRLQEDWGGDESDDNPTTTVTAYVTLEPCCHEGKTTPPCAAALVTAGVDRVVVGFRDPNPRVDGGGVRYLQERGVVVDFCNDVGLAQQCQDLVSDFCKRITPPFPTYEHVTGALRSSLRTMAAQKKQAKSLVEVSWGGESVQLPENDNGDMDARMTESIDALVLDPEWMEHLDGQLWRHEVVLLRLNSAVAKKRYAKQLGERIAQQLQAHVAQTAGHTVLLYRPGKPPVLDLERLVLEKRGVA